MVDACCSRSERRLWRGRQIQKIVLVCDRKNLNSIAEASDMRKHCGKDFCARQKHACSARKQRGRVWLGLRPQEGQRSRSLSPTPALKNNARSLYGLSG